MNDRATDCIGRPPAPPTRRLWIVLVLTGGFMLVEAIGGYLSGSLTLLADAGHMLTDVGAISLTLLTAWIAQRPPDQNKTYGYLRWEILAALINGAALIGIAGWVVVAAIQRLGNPPAIHVGVFLSIAALGLVVNLVGLGLLHGSHQGSLNARGVYLHILSDVLGSIAALAAALVVAFTGWTLADPIISIVLSLLILAGAWRLVRESTDVLLEAVPAHVSLKEVRRCMLSVPGVATIHDLHVWTVTSGMVAMSGHAVVPELDSHPFVLEQIRASMAQLGIGHVTIQLEMQHECLEVAGAAPGRDHHDHSHSHAR
ncbi:MAG: cation diffusion facilitator family transporter [Gemmatimonadota bacterium]